MKNPIRESYHHIALGSDTFIEKIKEKIEYQGRRREIPSTRFLTKYKVDMIIIKITQALNIERRMIRNRKCHAVIKNRALALR